MTTTSVMRPLPVPPVESYRIFDGDNFEGPLPGPRPGTTFEPALGRQVTDLIDTLRSVARGNEISISWHPLPIDPVQ